MEVDTSPTAQSLLSEHLTYTPLSLIDDIIDSVNHIIYQGINSLEAGLTSTPADRLGFGESDSNIEIDEGLHQLETLLNSVVDKNFDKFEIYLLRNILSIPAGVTPYIRLQHYEGLVAVNDVDYETIVTLRRKLRARRAVSRRLAAEMSRNQVVIARLKQSVDEVGFLKTGPVPVTGATKLAVSQLPALKGLMEDLRQRSNLLKTADPVSGLRDEQREERRGYIEQRTRDVLARVGLRESEGRTRVTREQADGLDELVASFHPA